MRHHLRRQAPHERGERPRRLPDGPRGHGETPDHGGPLRQRVRSRRGWRRRLLRWRLLRLTTPPPPVHNPEALPHDPGAPPTGPLPPLRAPGRPTHWPAAPPTAPRWNRHLCLWTRLARAETARLAGQTAIRTPRPPAQQLTLTSGPPSPAAHPHHQRSPATPPRPSHNSAARTNRHQALNTSPPAHLSPTIRAPRSAHRPSRAVELPAARHRTTPNRPSASPLSVPTFLFRVDLLCPSSFTLSVHRKTKLSVATNFVRDEQNCRRGR
jgi:hypothetical protein